MESLYAPPQSDIVAPPEMVVKPAGFWIRVGATIIDGIFLNLITLPVLFGLYGMGYFNKEPFSFLGGMDVFLSYGFPFLWYILFWVKKGATPGKMLLGLKIVSQDGSENLGIGQCIGRYFGYILSCLVIGLGCLWVIWDPKKHAWHDKMAGTQVVIK